MSDLQAASLEALTEELASSLEALNEENRNLRRELDVAHTVQILRCKDGVDGEDDEVIVYASGQFQEGKYATDDKMWQINLNTQHNTNDDIWERQLQLIFDTNISDSINTKIMCRLSDLKHCDVCVDGGFPVICFSDTEHTFHDSNFWEIDPNDGNDDSKAMKIYFNPLNSCIDVTIHGVPNDEWRPIFQKMKDDNCTLHETNLVWFLELYVAGRCPDATIEFTAVAFSTQKIHACLKRLLSPAQKSKARAERDARPEDPCYGFRRLLWHVCEVLRSFGDPAAAGTSTDGTVTTAIESEDKLSNRAREVMKFLIHIGMKDVTDENKSLIRTILKKYQTHDFQYLKRNCLHQILETGRLEDSDDDC